MKYKINLNEYEDKLIAELIQQKGYDEELIFRTALRLMHKTELKPKGYIPKYKSQADLTPEEQCLKDGGIVIDTPTGKQCKLKRGQLEFIRQL